MIYKKIILAFSVLTIFISCKKEGSHDSDLPEKPVELFKVGLDLVIQKDDSLQVFYKDIADKDWKSYNSVTNFVKGSPVVQQVLFKLPEDVVPKEIRIDFGTNIDQAPIEIRNFKMEYIKKTFQAKDTMFFQYFMPNDQIQYSRNTAIAKPIYKKGTTYDPLFLPREVLLVEIDKLLK